MEQITATMELAREAHEKWLMKNNNHDLEKAIGYYSDILVQNPSSVETQYRLTMLLWESGKISLSTAIEKCRNAVSLSPNDINARLYTGYFLKLADRYADAENEFKKAISINPFKACRPRINIGLMHSEKLIKGDFSLNHLAKAFYYFSTGLLTGIFDYSCMKLFSRKIKDKAAVFGFLAFGKILKTFGFEKPAVKTFRAAEIKTGHSEIFGKIIGDISINNENADEALDAYETVLDAHPFDRETLLKKASILQVYKKDKIREAIDTYTLALETEGEKDYIYYELGHLYLKLNDLINAVNAFSLAVNENNTNPYFHNALGFAYFKAGQYDEAEDHYLLAITLNPEPKWTAAVCCATALIYSDIKNRPEKAVRMYKQAISLDPESPDIYSALGDLYFDEEDYKNAKEYYTKSLSLNPDNVYVFNKYATSLWQINMTEESVIAYKNAITKDNNYAPSYNNLGVVYFDGKNDFLSAKSCFEKAVELNPEYVMAHFNLGRVYEQLGDKVNAAKNYSDALKLNCQNPETDNELIENKIKELFEVQ